MPLLQCVAQSYAWGKLGRESLVAQLKVRAAVPSGSSSSSSASAHVRGVRVHAAGGR